MSIWRTYISLVSSIGLRLLLFARMVKTPPGARWNMFDGFGFFLEVRASVSIDRKRQVYVSLS